MKTGKILRWRKTQPTDIENNSELIASMIASILVKYDTFIIRKFNRFSFVHYLCGQFMYQRKQTCEFIIINE